MKDKRLEFQKELKREAWENNRELHEIIGELRQQLDNGRDYLMQVKPKNLTVEDALEAFGFGRNGLK